VDAGEETKEKSREMEEEEGEKEKRKERCARRRVTFDNVIIVLIIIAIAMGWRTAFHRDIPIVIAANLREMFESRLVPSSPRARLGTVLGREESYPAFTGRLIQR